MWSRIPIFVIPLHTRTHARTHACMHARTHAQYSYYSVIYNAPGFLLISVTVFLNRQFDFGLPCHETGCSLKCLTQTNVGRIHIFVDLPHIRCS